MAYLRRKNETVCKCMAYSFPHRTGSGKCTYTRVNQYVETSNDKDPNEYGDNHLFQPEKVVTVW